MSRSTGSATTSVTITLIDTAKQAVSGQGVTITSNRGQVSLAKDNGDRTYASLIRLAAKQVQLLSRPRRRSATAPFRLPLYSLLDELGSWYR